MTGNPYVWAILSACFFGLALVLTPFVLRHISALGGATVTISTNDVVFAIASPFVIEWSHWNGSAVAVFAGVGCLFPAAVTLLTFEANRRIGPNLTGALGNLAPVFAVVFAVLMLGEVPRPMQGAGLAVIVVGVTVLITGSGEAARGWAIWAMALPLAAALLRPGPTRYQVWSEVLGQSLRGGPGRLHGFGVGRSHWRRRVAAGFSLYRRPARHRLVRRYRAVQRRCRAHSLRRPGARSGCRRGTAGRLLSVGHSGADRLLPGRCRDHPSTGRRRHRHRRRRRLAARRMTRTPWSSPRNEVNNAAGLAHGVEN